jgi:hypothetical protein
MSLSGIEASSDLRPRLAEPCEFLLAAIADGFAVILVSQRLVWVAVPQSQ